MAETVAPEIERHTALLRRARAAAEAASSGHTLATLMRLTDDELQKLIVELEGKGDAKPTGPAYEPTYTATPPELDPINQKIFDGIKPLVVHELDSRLKRFTPKDPMTKEEVEELAKKHSAEIATKAAIAEVEARVPKSHIITIHVHDKPPITISGVHFMFDELLYWVGEERENVYLYGQPGGGKTTAAAQVAQALDRPFGYISLNLQTSESRLIGFIAPDNKTYRPTQFRDCYEHGGVFLVDEFDNMSDSVATSLNGALENGYCAFPDKKVDKHPDFVCIASGNTAGRGGNIMHAGRRALDAATLERFVYLHWPYDLDLEQREVFRIADTDISRQWLAWVRDVRRFIEENDVKLVASPRASMKGAAALAHSRLSPEQIADRVLFKGVNDDIRRQVLANCPLPKIVRPTATRKKREA